MSVLLFVVLAGPGILRVCSRNSVATTQLNDDFVPETTDPRTSATIQPFSGGFPETLRGQWELYSRTEFGETTTLLQPTHPEMREVFDLISVSRDAIATDYQGIAVVSSNIQTGKNNRLQFSFLQGGERLFTFSGSCAPEDGGLILNGTMRRFANDSTSSELPVELKYRRVPTEKMTVVLVHGTYEGSSSWVNEVPGKVTFASELRRELGNERASIEPFLWRSANDHGSRVRAAEDLAKIIDDSRFAGSRIIVIAFSHGGSVALSAAGKCNRRIDQLICLGTPHCSVVAIKDDSDLVMMPVYCTPKSMSNVTQIINLWSRSDTVTRANSPLGAPWASIDPGLTQADAIADTYEWRRQFNYPRLIDDGDVPREILAKLTDTTFNTCLFAVPVLVTATHNLEIASEKSGVDAHTSMHCTRMGSLLGRILRWGPHPDTAQTEYLSEFVVPASADTGEARSWDAAEVKEAAHRACMQFGWTLEDLTIEPPTTKRNGDAWDKLSKPDFYAAFTSKSRAKWTSSIAHDASIAELNCIEYFPFGTYEIVAWDKDVIQDDVVGSLAFTMRNGDSPPTVIQGNGIKVRMQWRPAHY